MDTGEIVPNYDPAELLQDRMRRDLSLGPSAGGRQVKLATIPNRYEFMLVGHVLMAMVFGYVGLSMRHWVTGQRRWLQDRQTNGVRQGSRCAV